MEHTRLFLTNEDNKFYVIKLSTDANPEFSQRIYFPYFNGEEQQSLKKARDFGKTLAKNLHTTLEIDEKLTKTSEN